MFCRRSRRNPLWALMLLIFGMRHVMREKNWTEEDRKAYRSKRRLFRNKLHEAFSVWDEDDKAESPISQEN